MNVYQIKHRDTGAVIFESNAWSMRECVERAVRSGVSLSKANFAGASLERVNIPGAKLSEANFSGAYVVGAHFEGANLFGVYAPGANFSGSTFLNANAVRANLAGANMTGVNIVGTKFAGASLAGVNLTGTDILGVDLSEAYLEGVMGIDTLMVISPIGSRDDSLTVLNTSAGLNVHVGCFSGTLDEFAEAVKKTHGDTKHGRDYRLAIELIRSKFGLDGRGGRGLLK